MYRDVQHNYWCGACAHSPWRGLGAQSPDNSARNSPRGRTPSWRTSIVARIVYCWFVAWVSPPVLCSALLCPLLQRHLPT